MSGNFLEMLKKHIPAKNPNRRGFSSFLFVLMSVSGGVHGDFLKPFRRSSALCGVSFKCLMYGRSVKVLV